MAGQARNGANFTPTFGLQLYYDPPPQPLTRSQLARASCGLTARVVAEIRPPPTEGQYYTRETFSGEQEFCRSPYEVPADAPSDGGPQVARDGEVRCPDGAGRGSIHHGRGYEVAGDRFTVEADVGELLERHGAGVDAVQVWATVDGEPAVISGYSVFHKVELPERYV